MASSRGPQAVVPHGTRAFTLEYDDVRAVMAHHAAIVATSPAGVVDLVPAAATILVEVDPAVRTLDEVAEELMSLLPLEIAAGDPAMVELPVRYDGPDLAEVAQLADCSPDELVRRHTALTWTAAFTGFAPGFAYLVAEGGDWLPDVPRRAEPRVAVPAGAVGLAGVFTGVYPRPSPGGWQVIGTTEATLWDTDRTAPALLATGARVRFVEVR